MPTLLPLLDRLGQDVSVETNAKGKPTCPLNHWLKIFLMDPQFAVREIYSVPTLDQAALVNDMKTVAGEGSNRG